MIVRDSSASRSRLASLGSTTWNSSPPRPADQAGFAHRALQPLADLLEQRVAALMAHRVVDCLEPVEIEQQQRGASDRCRSAG